ncbi:MULTISPECIES: hypothetical protein [Thalassotalea]|uniref:Lipoprotein n=1 Tax=Thalassotalea castellviae TaxID=3075612 RepID=A0ABU3A489_9GAMM|nr:hypothetical protein [Thalassotalea sp. W431]MDT0604984.1 hypothetical protein [Thalassotalea sp. W431]
MKKLLTSLIILLSVTGCSSVHEYKPVNHTGYGYQESVLNDNVIRVHFTSRSNNKLKVIDYTLLRSAELTLNQGYDWFVITHREVYVDRKKINSSLSLQRHYQTSTQCGLLTCSKTPSHNTSVGLSINDKPQEDIESIMEIKLGKGVRPDEKDSFDARQLSENLRLKYQISSDA